MSWPARPPEPARGVLSRRAAAPAGVVLLARAAASLRRRDRRAAGRGRGEVPAAAPSNSTTRCGWGRPGSAGTPQSGEVTTLATRGLDGLDAYFARYLPQLVLACLVPVAVLIRVGLADWSPAWSSALTLPLIPVFAILVGLHTKATTLAAVAAAGPARRPLPRRGRGAADAQAVRPREAQAEVIGKVTEEYRAATMSTLRVAFLSGLRAGAGRRPGRRAGRGRGRAQPRLTGTSAARPRSSR